MNVQFGVNSEANKTATPAPVIEIAAVVTPSPTPAQTAAPATPLAVVKTSPSGLVLGDKLPELKDIILPRINIVQGIGKLKDTFPQGGIIFGQNTLLFEPPTFGPDGRAVKTGLPPIVLTVLGFRPTRFVEKIQGGERGIICNTEEEVAAHGGTLDWAEWNLKKASGMKRFEQLAEAMVAIRRPEHVANDDTVFVYDIESHKYALAIWAMKGTSYTAAAKKVFFTGRYNGALRGGYPTFSWNVTTRLEKYPGGNAAWVPVCLPNTKSTPVFMEFVSSVLG